MCAVNYCGGKMDAVVDGQKRGPGGGPRSGHNSDDVKGMIKTDQVMPPLFQQQRFRAN
jgi:hypothetical protein